LIRTASTARKTDPKKDETVLLPAVHRRRQLIPGCMIAVLGGREFEEVDWYPSHYAAFDRLFRGERNWVQRRESKQSHA
jgi:hypothetical protein